VRLEIGDLIRVRYPKDKFYDGECSVGIVIETTRSPGPYTINKMWCFKTESTHIIDVFRDEIEVLNK
jgi:hypothetical protein